MIITRVMIICKAEKYNPYKLYFYLISIVVYLIEEVLNHISLLY